MHFRVCCHVVWQCLLEEGEEACEQKRRLQCNVFLCDSFPLRCRSIAMKCLPYLCVFRTVFPFKELSQSDEITDSRQWDEPIKSGVLLCDFLCNNGTLHKRVRYASQPRFLSCLVHRFRGGERSHNAEHPPFSIQEYTQAIHKQTKKSNNDKRRGYAPEAKLLHTCHGMNVLLQLSRPLPPLCPWACWSYLTAQLSSSLRCVREAYSCFNIFL